MRGSTTPEDLLADFKLAEIPEWECKICKSTNCFNCYPSVCQRHIEMEDEATAKMIRSMSKMCPKRGCGRRIMRSGGCAHMTCRKMGGEGMCLFLRPSLTGSFRKRLWHRMVLELQGHLGQWETPCSKLSLVVVGHTSSSTL